MPTITMSPSVTITIHLFFISVGSLVTYGGRTLRCPTWRPVPRSIIYLTWQLTLEPRLKKRLWYATLNNGIHKGQVYLVCLQWEHQGQSLHLLSIMLRPPANRRIAMEICLWRGSGSDRKMLQQSTEQLFISCLLATKRTRPQRWWEEMDPGAGQAWLYCPLRRIVVFEIWVFIFFFVFSKAFY